MVEPGRKSLLTAIDGCEAPVGLDELPQPVTANTPDTRTTATLRMRGLSAAARLHASV
jgi:hypothetical protein